MKRVRFQSGRASRDKPHIELDIIICILYALHVAFRAAFAKTLGLFGHSLPLS